jgi:hypothetical protein
VERTNSPRDAARGEWRVVTCADLEKPAADDRRAQLCERRPIAGALEEAYELGQVIAVPTDRPRAPTGDPEGNPVLVH